MTPESAEKAPDLDVELKIKSSISSLKELVIIFTGLTITASFAVFVTSHFYILSKDNRQTAAIWFTWQTLYDGLLLILLVLCVMRFYHGNIMILDRHYLIKDEPSLAKRNLTVDSTAVLAMTFGLAFLGLTIDRYLWFFIIYLFITLISVLWNWYVNSSNFNLLFSGGREAIPDTDRDEVLTQRNWWRWNLSSFSIIFLLLAFGVTRSHGWRGSDMRVDLVLENWAFYSILAVCYLNSVADLLVNKKEYFPRRRARPVAAGGVYGKAA